jgi:hypothetical protein
MFSVCIQVMLVTPAASDITWDQAARYWAGAVCVQPYWYQLPLASGANERITGCPNSRTCRIRLAKLTSSSPAATCAMDISGRN